MTTPSRETTCRDCRGVHATLAAPCERCGADGPFTTSTSTLAWLLLRVDNESQVTWRKEAHPNADHWRVARRLDDLGVTPPARKTTPE